MGFKCGILGLSNVGKSTVFNALTATAAAQASNYPFSTIEPNVGDVLVPDPRLEVLAKIEAEIAVLPANERAEYLTAIGLKEPGLDRLIRAGYALLDLITYFTAGPKEARAWTVTRGSKAPQAAGVIHSDFERGFIRAETIAYDDYVAFGGEAGAREAGKMRL